MKPTSDLSVVMTALYRSEINCSVSSFWDSGWTAMIGDSMNGYKACLAELSSPRHVAEWLTKAACEHLPESGFAQNVHDLPGWLELRG